MLTLLRCQVLLKVSLTGLEANLGYWRSVSFYITVLKADSEVQRSVVLTARPSLATGSELSTFRTSRAVYLTSCAVHQLIGIKLVTIVELIPTVTNQNFHSAAKISLLPNRLDLGPIL